MIIRCEDQQDVRAIREVIRQAFAGAAHSSGTEPAIVDALRASGALRLSFVAVEDGAILGHVAISPVTLSDGQEGWSGLGPVSVQPERQRQGIGSALIGKALERLRENPAANGCVVLGDPNYYSRFGFRHEPRVTYGDVPPPYFQVLLFRGQPPVGVVQYHEAFTAEG